MTHVRGSKYCTAAFSAGAVLDEAAWREPAVNKGGNTRFWLSSFCKGRELSGFYALGRCQTLNGILRRK